MSTHEAVTARQVELVVSAKTAGGEAGQTLAEMVEAQLLTCRLEVTSDQPGPIEPLGDGRFRAVLVPALDQTNRRQFRGCVEDFVTDHLQIDVIEFNEIDQLSGQGRPSILGVETASGGRFRAQRP